MKQFDGLTWLTLTRIFYDRFTDSQSSFTTGWVPAAGEARTKI